MPPANIYSNDLQLPIEEMKAKGVKPSSENIPSLDESYMSSAKINPSMMNSHSKLETLKRKKSPRFLKRKKKLKQMSTKHTEMYIEQKKKKL